MSNRERQMQADHMCEHCEEQPAIVRVSVTTLDGSVLDTQEVCRDCWHSAKLADTLAIGEK